MIESLPILLTSAGNKFGNDVELSVPMVLGNVNNLPQSLTIDGVAFAPCAYLVADDANAGTWMSRHDVSKALSVVGAGTAPTIGNATAITNNAVRYAAAKYHQASDTTWAQISTTDGALECVFSLDAVASQTIFTTFASNIGISLTTDGSGNLLCLMRDGTGSLVTLQHNGLLANTIYHVWVGIDRSEKAYMYVNGVAAATTPSASVTGIALTWTSAAVIVGTTAPVVTHLAMWSMGATTWGGALKNATYMGAIARERFAIVAGIQDQKAGAHTFTRATSAYVDHYVSATKRQLFAVSAGWPRVCNRKDSVGTEVTGYLSELQYVNDFLYSEDATQWAQVRCTISATPITAPDGTLTADGIVSDAGNNTHYVNLECAADASQHVFSAWLKAGAQNWARMDIHTVANAYAYFDVSASAGAMGTVGADIDSYGIEPWGDGWYRCWIEYTGVAPAHDHHIHTANANDGQTWDSPGSVVDLYVWGVQHENAGAVAPTSYIKTAAAKVTRNKDQLTYDVRLPIVGDINSLSQTLTIGSTDYAPCAFLVADDVNVSTGAWASRHNATKALAYAGAGTNPTPQWDAVSRVNKSIKYWASNYHTAADTTWAQLDTDDGALECIFALSTIASQTILTTYAANTGMQLVTNATGNLQCLMRDGTGGLVTLQGQVLAANTLYHAFVGMDRSEKAYLFINGVIATGTPSADITGNALTWTSAALILGTSAPQIAQVGMWDLAGTPWPGAATNQATMAAIARARFNQLFRYTSCRLDCEILHPDVNRQVFGIILSSGNASDYNYTAISTNDAAYSEGKANGAAQWSGAASTDVCDGVCHRLVTRERPNQFSLKVDNVAEVTDASCELPAGQSKVFVGQFYDGTYQPTCLVGGVKLWRSDR